MNKICTSLEQSQKLIKLGIDISTADMIYTNFYGKVSKSLPMPKEVYDILKYPINGDKCVPAWSLSALLDMIDSQSGLGKDYDLWICYDNRKSHITKHHEHAIDAVFEMVVWLKENNKI